MRRTIDKIKTKKVGSAPGTLVHIGQRKKDRITLNLIDYDASTLQERELASVEDLLPLKETTSVSWVNIDGIHDVGTIERVGQIFAVHPLVLEDILNTEHRPKFEESDDSLFIVLKMLFFDDAIDGISTEQVSLILTKNCVLCFQEREGDVFDGVRERLRGGKGRIRKRGADYLAYALIDSIVDSYFHILEKLGDRIEVLEEELITQPTQATLKKIHHFKGEMIRLRKSVWPLREVISSLQRSETPLIDPTTGVFLQDVYDHTIQVVDTVETYRDIISGFLDLYLSSISNRMNEVMKVLTIIATIFIPLTFLAGIYGMNFEHMPELKWRWSYAVFWAIIVVAGGAMFAFFRRKKWL